MISTETILLMLLVLLTGLLLYTLIKYQKYFTKYHLLLFDYNFLNNLNKAKFGEIK